MIRGIPLKTARTLERACAESDFKGMVACLTDRQRESLVLLSKGYSNEEAGRLLGCGKHTVAAHRAAIYRRLDVSTAPEAAVIAAKAGLV